MQRVPTNPSFSAIRRNPIRLRRPVITSRKRHQASECKIRPSHIESSRKSPEVNTQGPKLLPFHYAHNSQDLFSNIQPIPISPDLNEDSVILQLNTLLSKNPEKKAPKSSYSNLRTALNSKPGSAITDRVLPRVKSLRNLF